MIKVMVSLSITALVMLVVAGAVAVAAPAIAADAEVYSFGSVIEGYAVSHTFVLQNVGDEVLEISKVRVTCGCTATELANDRLAPGESVDLDVVVNTTGFSGTLSKTIYVYSNDPARSNPDGTDGALILRVTGTLQRAQDYHTSVADMNYLFTVLVDLRDAEAYATGHLMGAISVPADGILDWIEVLPLDTLIILVDQEGEVAATVAEELVDAGYAQARFLDGGMSWWVHVSGTELMIDVNDPISVSGDARQMTASSLALHSADLQYLFYLLVDLRDPDAYAAGHLSGAISIPFLEIARWIDRLPEGKPIFLYSDNGMESDAAVQVLANAQFSEARSLLGGLEEWTRQFGDRFIMSDQLTEGN